MQTKEEFACAVKDHKDTVFRVAFSYMKNQDDADDITQTVFLKLFKSDIAFPMQTALYIRYRIRI